MFLRCLVSYIVLLVVTNSLLILLAAIRYYTNREVTNGSKS